MEAKRFGTLGGLKVAILAYSTLAEAIAAGGEERCLEELNATLVYRGPLDDARELICELVEEETGIERPTKDTGKKDSEGNPILTYTEKPGEYIDRVLATQKWENLQSLQEKVDAAVAAKKEKDGTPTFQVDVRKTVRKGPGVVKLAKKYLETADAILKNPDVTKAQAMFAKWNVAWPTFVGDAAKDRDTLARGVKAVQEAVEAATKNSFTP